ncbi:MAG: hypothetical protein JWO36_3649 [Myxococcales bacterium]|nr:hypothetical protein [Myxococcales bacterium]
MQRAAIVFLAGVGCSSPAGVIDAAPPDQAAAPDAAQAASFSFVVVGCNRVEKADITTNNPSTANLAELDRTFAEIAALSPPPKFLFFAGDMVYGYKDAATLQPELAAWLAHYDASPLAAAGVELVPVPGNHEMQTKQNGLKYAYPEAEATWVAVMGSRIRGSNGPAAGGADQLQTDQARLDYSFDFSGTHFVVLDTDPVGADGSVPTTWVTADVSAARASGAAHIFAISHKPAYPSPLSAEGGFTSPAVRDALWTALEQNHAEAMLSAHNHLWYKTRPASTWQIVAGNGGSLLESTVPAADAFYGFTLVEVGASVTVKSFGRDVPSAGYLAPATPAKYPTTLRDTTDITWH